MSAPQVSLDMQLMRELDALLADVRVAAAASETVRSSWVRERVCKTHDKVLEMLVTHARRIAEEDRKWK